ncbi:MAG: hypothetical protein JSW34_06055 [Candidatus Zixiibacteriota bacterium]|nr:MAG: hypothetical protein JSW34_06055 [candidate division Zixibacteria bacterium]
MKRLLIIAVCAALVFASQSFADAAGSAFGALSTAGTLGMGNGNFGLSVGLADATSFAGSFSYGLSAHTDGRIKLGLYDPDGGDTEIAIGADFKYQLISVGGVSNGPFDMAVGAFGEFFQAGAADVFLLGGQFLGSYPVKLQRGGTLTPYGRFNIRLESISIDVIDQSDTELEIGLNGGVEWTVTADIALFGEFQIDGNDGVFFGVEFGAL